MDYVDIFGTKVHRNITAQKTFQECNSLEREPLRCCKGNEKVTLTRHFRMGSFSFDQHVNVLERAWKDKYRTYLLNLNGSVKGQIARSEFAYHIVHNCIHVIYQSVEMNIMFMIAPCSVILSYTFANMYDLFDTSFFTWTSNGVKDITLCRNIPR